MRLTAFSRLLRILHIFARYRLDQILLALPLPWLARLALQLGPWRLRPAPRDLSRGARLRKAHECARPDARTASAQSGRQRSCERLRAQHARECARVLTF